MRSNDGVRAVGAVRRFGAVAVVGLLVAVPGAVGNGAEPPFDPQTADQSAGQGATSFAQTAVQRLGEQARATGCPAWARMRRPG